MTEIPAKPILFSGPMVRAILEGHKTQTRRFSKIQPERRDWNPPEHSKDGGFYVCPDLFPTTPQRGHVIVERNGAAYHSLGQEGFAEKYCPYGRVGSKLWVRETWKYGWTPSCGHGIFYRADDHFKCFNTDGYSQEYQTIVAKYGNDFRKEPWRRSIFLPRWASRITLEVTEVRVEKLNDISEEDARAEGVEPYDGMSSAGYKHCTAFRLLWDKINGKRYPWESNCYVWVISFRRVN